MSSIASDCSPLAQDSLASSSNPLHLVEEGGPMDTSREDRPNDCGWSCKCLRANRAPLAICSKIIPYEYYKIAKIET